MPRTCRSGRHRPAALVVWNCGLRFSTCERCGRDIVGRGNDAWTLPPKGTRISWRSDPPPYYLIPQARLSDGKPRPNLLDLSPIRASPKAMRWAASPAMKTVAQEPRQAPPRSTAGIARRSKRPGSSSTALVIWKPGLLGLATFIAFVAFKLRWRQ